MLGVLDTDIMRAINAFEAVSIVKSEDWDQLDPVVMAVALDAELVAETKYSQNSIVLCGKSLVDFCILKSGFNHNV